MNIYAIEGHRVTFSKPTSGNEYDKIKANKYLLMGETYTVESTSVDKWETTVSLKEFPTIRFNSVMFEDVDTQPDSDNLKHPDYKCFHRIPEPEVKKQKTMNKQFTYKNFTFNIKVDLNKISPDEFDNVHVITINDMGPNNFYKTAEAKDETLENKIKQLEEAATYYVDSKTKKPLGEEILAKLGFE